jgi:2'-5' RNA ligase
VNPVVVRGQAGTAAPRRRPRCDRLLPDPPHITILFPFMPPETIDPPALTRLGQLFAGVSRFRFRLHHTDWFGDDVLWLAPQDPRPFRALTQRVFRAYPAFPPFEGQFDDVTPHLTIGHGHPLNDLRTAEDSVQGRLPIEAGATAVTLMASALRRRLLVQDPTGGATRQAAQATWRKVRRTIQSEPSACAVGAVISCRCQTWGCGARPCRTGAPWRRRRVTRRRSTGSGGPASSCGRRGSGPASWK